MNKRIRKGMIGALALAMAAGAGPFAFAKGAKGPSGNMNFRLNGYEVISSKQVSILAIGQVIANAEGQFGGTVTFTVVDPSTPAADVCTASIDSSTTPGTIKAPPADSFGTPSGLFEISMPFASITGTGGAGGLCEVDYESGDSLTLMCNRTLVHKNLVNDLDAGEYHCVATGATSLKNSVPVSAEGHLDISAGSNSPNG